MSTHSRRKSFNECCRTCRSYSNALRYVIAAVGSGHLVDSCRHPSPTADPSWSPAYGLIEAIRGLPDLAPTAEPAGAQPRRGRSARQSCLRSDRRGLPLIFERMEFMNAGRLSRLSGHFTRPAGPPAATELGLAFRRVSLGCLRRGDDPGQEHGPSLRGAISARSKPFNQSDSAILKPGRRLGPYRLLVRLGQGGQGEVWKTRRLGPTEELVALKVMKPEMADIRPAWPSSGARPSAGRD